MKSLNRQNYIFGLNQFHFSITISPIAPELFINVQSIAPDGLWRLKGIEQGDTDRGKISHISGD
jgi:hypothetical protein